MWAIHNSLKGWTLYDLTDREAQLLVNSMSLNEIKLAKVCAVGANWENLDKEKHGSLFLPQTGLTGIEKYQKYENKVSVGDDAADTGYFVIQPKKTFYPRLFDRIDLAVNASIIGQTQVFDTLTIDLSEGGIHFQDHIPSWLSGYFIVKITDKDATYSVMCSLVEDQKEKKRVQIVSEENDPQFVKYKNWLHSQLSK